MSDDQLSPGANQIFEWVNEQLGRKEVAVGSANRCSSAPQCVRKRWLQNQGVKGEPMQPRSLVVFATGDVVEHVVKYFIAKACVGPDKLYSEVDFGAKDGTFTIQHREFDIYKQETLAIQFPTFTVTGHPDGWGKRNSDGEWELIEIKSAATYGYDEFVEGKVEYLKQVHALLLSEKARQLKARSARFFYMNKNTSALHDRLYWFDEQLAQEVFREFIVAAGPHEPSVPEQENIGPQAITKYNRSTKQYDSTGQYKLGWKCGYCDYRERCWPNARKEFVGGKPVFYIDELMKVGTDE